MPTLTEGAPDGAPLTEPAPPRQASVMLLDQVSDWLADAKAENVVSIDLAGKSAIGDFMLIASGRSDRHVGAIADRLLKQLKQHGVNDVRVEGLPGCDWVLIDAGDIIVHIFRPEVRDFYNLEKMWLAEPPTERLAS